MVTAVNVVSGHNTGHEATTIGGQPPSRGKAGHEVRTRVTETVGAIPNAGEGQASGAKSGATRRKNEVKKKRRQKEKEMKKKEEEVFF
jgi:hypothetical protein